jgi:hypothetical protein
MPEAEARLLEFRRKPPPWVSELAEALVPFAQRQDAGTISQRIRQAARAHDINEPWVVALLVAHEWDRLGIIRASKDWALGGW